MLLFNIILNTNCFFKNHNFMSKRLIKCYSESLNMKYSSYYLYASTANRNPTILLHSNPPIKKRKIQGQASLPPFLPQKKCRNLERGWGS